MSDPKDSYPVNLSAEPLTAAYLDPTVSLGDTYLFPEIVSNVDPDGGASRLTLRYQRQGDGFMVGECYSRHDHRMTPTETVPGTSSDWHTFDGDKISPYADASDMFIIRTDKAAYSSSGKGAMFVRQWKSEDGKVLGKEYETDDAIGLGISGRIGDEIRLPGSDSPETVLMVELNGPFDNGTRPNVIKRRKSPLVVAGIAHEQAIKRADAKARTLGGGAISGN